MDVHDPRRRHVGGRQARSRPKRSPGASSARSTPRRSRPVRARSTPRTTSRPATDYGVPTPTRARSATASPSTARTSPSRWPSRSPTWTTGAPSWRWARLRWARPAAAGLRPETRCPTVPTRSSRTARRGAHAGQERPVGPDDRPGASPVRRQVDLQVQRGPGQVDQIMLWDNTDSQTADRRPPSARTTTPRPTPSSVTRLVQQSSQCSPR